MVKDDKATGKRVVAGTHWDFDSYGGTIKKQLGMPTQASHPDSVISNFIFSRNKLGLPVLTCSPQWQMQLASKLYVLKQAVIESTLPTNLTLYAIQPPRQNLAIIMLQHCCTLAVCQSLVCLHVCLLLWKKGNAWLTPVHLRFCLFLYCFEGQ